MKAVYVERVGPPEVLIYGELPEPQAGPNDVLIRVRATSLNRLDVFMREGSHGTSITPPAKWCRWAAPCKGFSLVTEWWQAAVAVTLNMPWRQRPGLFTSQRLAPL